MIVCDGSQIPAAEQRPQARLGDSRAPPERAVTFEGETLVIRCSRADQVAPATGLRRLPVEAICLGEEPPDLQVLRVGGHQTLETLPSLPDSVVFQVRPRPLQPPHLPILPGPHRGRESDRFCAGRLSQCFDTAVRARLAPSTSIPRSRLSASKSALTDAPFEATLTICDSTVPPGPMGSTMEKYVASAWVSFVICGRGVCRFVSAPTRFDMRARSGTSRAP